MRSQISAALLPGPRLTGPGPAGPAAVAARNAPCRRGSTRHPPE